MIAAVEPIPASAPAGAGAGEGGTTPAPIHLCCSLCDDPLGVPAVALRRDIPVCEAHR